MRQGVVKILLNQHYAFALDLYHFYKQRLPNYADSRDEKKESRFSDAQVSKISLTSSNLCHKQGFIEDGSNLIFGGLIETYCRSPVLK